ncbi:carbohydrate kinase [Mollicutes bacterium LVI A0039]|nr:carbohydrate kinase [Mollicutes bacterium LVI A0039]
MKKILCPGEALIDLFGVEGKPLVDTIKFEKKAGGAPANAAGAMAKFGVASYFAGSVGNDPYGHFLKREMDKYHIDTTYLQLLDQHFTSFAHVSIDETGERDFIFNRGADAQFTLQDIDLEKFDGFHFASATAFLGNHLNEAYDQILEYASNHNKFISFDANYRDALFGSNQEVFIQKCKMYIEKAHLIKLSEEELLLISGITDVTEAGTSLSLTTAGYIVVTLGSEGSILFYNGKHVHIPTIKVDKVIDTTGAGDAFIGCLVAQAINVTQLNCETLIPLIATASKVGALTTAKIGALESIPDQSCI